jgi:hypothetical protein
MAISKCLPYIELGEDLPWIMNCMGPHFTYLHEVQFNIMNPFSDWSKITKLMTGMLLQV